MKGQKKKGVGGHTEDMSLETWVATKYGNNKGQC